MRTITLEEHYASPAFMAGPGRNLVEEAKVGGGLAADLPARLCDLGAQRIAEMDAAGIDTQVLSLTSPGVEQLDAAEAIALARDANDFAAQAVRAYPDRFAGFAAVPTAAPAAAAAELQRAVRQDGFKGALVNGHTRGRYLDDKFFWPIFESAVALDVPIYLHPTEPPRAVVATSYGGFDPRVTFMLANAGWGWHIETAVHVLRIILGGVFDRFPKLQLIIGHLGEALPFMISRLDIMSPKMTGLPDQRVPSRERQLHVQRVQLHADLHRPVARSRYRSDHVFGRLSVCINGERPLLSGPTSGLGRGSRSHRLRQCATVAQDRHP